MGSNISKKVSADSARAWAWVVSRAGALLGEVRQERRWMGGTRPERGAERCRGVVWTSRRGSTLGKGMMFVGVLPVMRPPYRGLEGEARNNFCLRCGEMGRPFQGAPEGGACAWV
jgi:hypothetical protein